MRFVSAITVAAVAHCAVEVASRSGTRDHVREFARSVVVPSRPLALTNTREDRVTWPIWGSAFDVADIVRARVVLAPRGRAGIVVAFADPGARRAFALLWNGVQWTLAETIGDAIVQEVSIDVSLVGPTVVELSNGARSIAVQHGGAIRARLTMRDAAAGPLGFYVQLDPGAELVIADFAMTAPVHETELDPPLKALAKARGRALGSTSETGDWPPRHDLAFEALYAREFDTAGILDFYWTTTRGEDHDFDFVPADLMVNYATVRGQTIDGYFLVWDEELPAWLGETADLGAVLDAHIETVVRRYRGRVRTWIVANEAFLGPDENGTDAAGYADSIWHAKLGPGFIARAFRVADAADPDATLVYNETGAEAEGAKSDFVYARIAELVRDGVPIDAVGLQFHVDAAAPPDMASVRRNMQRFAALGLDVRITELDVNLANLRGTPAARLARQAELFGAVVRTCLAVPACKSITLFGFSDKHAWDELGASGASPEPLIFTREYQPKPAYHAVRDALAE